MADDMTQIGTRAIFDSDHDMFRESVRNYWKEHIIPFHDQWEEDGEISNEAWEEAGRQGMLGVTMPEQYGGLGVDIKYSAIVWEEQSYANCTGPGFALHSEICMPYILNYGTQEQKDRILPKLIAGTSISAIAMTEPGAGSDLAGVRTTAEKDSNGDFILNGSKTYITNGAKADHIIVVAKTDTSKGAHGISLLIVEEGMEGFNRGRKLKKLGLRAQDTSELFFDNVKVPAANLLGKENAGFYMLMDELPQERLLIADMAIAAAEANFEWTRDYVKNRKAFGKTLLNLQTIRHKLAELKTEICVGRAFADQCIELHSQGRLDSATASMAKYWLTDLQCKVADECVQLHGGAGFMWEYPITKAYADARVQRIYGGSNEIMKELISRNL